MEFNFLSKASKSNVGAGKNYVSCLLQGGLGNQLFILAAGLEQAERLSVPLIVDDSLYVETYGRKQEVSDLQLGANVSFLSTQPAPRGLDLKSQIKLGNRFAEKSFRFDKGIFQIKSRTNIEGYFQSYKYFPSISGKLLSSLRSIKYSPDVEEIIRHLSSKEFIAVHVRRGDYASNPSTQAFHGLTSSMFFQRSLALSQLVSKINRVLVFSDSPEVAMSVLPKDLGLKYEIVPNYLSNFGTLELMSRGSSIVMSNSSFSWWAAWLSSNSGTTTHPVIAPRPWFAEDINTDDLLLPSWMSIGN